MVSRNVMMSWYAAREPLTSLSRLFRLPRWQDSVSLRAFFDYASALGIDGMMVSPGYSYEKAPDQEHFLKRERTKELFRKVFAGKKWDFNHSPFFLDFLQGKREYQC